MMQLVHEIEIMNRFCEYDIPNVFKFLNGADALEHFLEVEEQLVAEYLVYGEVLQC